MQKPHQYKSRTGFEVIAPAAVLVGWAMLCQVSQVCGIDIGKVNVSRTGSNSLTLTANCAAVSVTASDPNTCANTPLLCAIVLPCGYSVCGGDSPVVLTFPSFDTFSSVSDCELDWIKDAMGLGPNDCVQAYKENSVSGFCKEGGPVTAMLTFSVCPDHSSDPDCMEPPCKGDPIAGAELDAFLAHNKLSGLVTFSDDLTNETCPGVHAPAALDCGSTFVSPPGTVVSAGACCNTLTGGCTEEVAASECSDAQANWTEFASCADIQCSHFAIPTISEWGLVVMALLLLAGAKVSFARRSETGSP